MSHVADAHKYCRDVIKGKIPACKWTIAACLRQMDDLERAKKKGSPIVWRPEMAERVCKFAELMPHIKGEWAKRKEKIKLEPWQKFILCTVFGWYLKSGTRRFRTSYKEIPRKNAKALALDTLIPTPDGFKLMEDIHRGDYVMGRDGSACKVIGESEIFTDHDCYEVTFSTGEKITADAGHLWLTDSRVDRDNKKGVRGKNGGPKPSVKTTEEIAGSVRIRGEANHRISLSLPLLLPEKILPIDPYSLGVWLGDGHSHSGRMTCHFEDYEIVDLISKNGEPIKKCSSGSTKTTGLYAFTNGRGGDKKTTFGGRLRALGVMDNKHIPMLYLRGSFSQRLELLRGLMDTDGSITSRGQCTFTSTNKTLVMGLWQLVASLGLKPSMDIQSAKLYGKECGTAYRVQFWAYDNFPVFNLTRKRAKQKAIPPKETRTAYRQIISVEKVDPVPVKCIMVDSPDQLFLVGGSCIPTHNSTLSSAAGLYMLTADGEEGAEVYSAATTRDQARIVFGDAQAMARKEPRFRDKFGVEVNAHNINVLATSSKFESLSAEGSTLDGLNVHCGILDELHAHKKRDVFDVIETGTGAREQSLLWLITTSGSNRAGICYEQRTYVTKILNGVLKRHPEIAADLRGGCLDDDSYFGIIYTIDEEQKDADGNIIVPGDDWATELAWRKANPNYGVSVKPDDIERLCRKAQQITSAQNNFLTKRLNVWVNADTAWMNMRAWDRCADPSLKIEDFYSQPCRMAFDFASKIDIAARGQLFRRDDHYYFFLRSYLPEDAVEDNANSQYSGWAKDGRIITTPGNVLDFDAIEHDLIDDSGRFEIKEVEYDPFQATQFATRMADEGFEMVEMRPTVLNFSEPMKELEKLVMQGKFHHDGDPVLSWMISNVVAHMDNKDNIYPRKEKPENKIDGVISLLMCLGREITSPIESSGYDLRAKRGEPVLRTL